MSGKRLPRALRLATPAQLWTLNRAGRIVLLGDDEPDVELKARVSSAQADGGIKASMRRAAEKA